MHRRGTKGMRKLALPSENHDLRKYSLWRVIKPPLWYFIYIAFLALSFYFYLERRPENLGGLAWWIHLLFAFVIIVSGWFIFRMTEWCLDKAISGKIESHEVVRSYGRGLSRGAKTVVDFHTYLKITVITDSGKRKKVSVPLFDDGYDGYYKTGSLLLKYKGLNYPICPDSEAEGSHLCTVCGVRTYYKEGKAVHGEAQPEIRDGLVICRSCGRSLVKM